MGQIGIGIIGAGNISEFHASAVNQSDAAKLIGLWDLDLEVGNRKSKEYNCRLFESPLDLCADPKVDAVLVLSPMESHSEYVMMAAEAGKHVLVEKPTASSINEINSIQNAVNKYNIKCMPVHNYIYEDSINRAKQMISQGKLGRITQFYMMYNIHHSDEVRVRYPGVIRQILTHHCYTMLYLAGIPETVSCLKYSTNPEFAPQENVAMANIQMKDGVLSHLCASFANDDHSGDPWTCIIKVMGTEGSTRYSYRDWVINKPNGPHSQTFYCYPETIKNTVDYFIEKVLLKGFKPLSSIEDALTCQKVIEACELSALENQHIKL